MAALISLAVMVGGLAVQAEPPPEACAQVNAAISRLTVSPEVARQGIELSIRAETPMGPYNPRPVPPECLSDWRISPAAAASLSDDHAVLTIAPDAPPDERLEVSVMATGYVSGRITRAMTLVAADAFVLTGRWRQTTVSCIGGSQPDHPVQELRFMDGGGFNLTYRPFETYVDYWGAYEWDRDARRLSLSITGGNDTPGADTMTANATVEEGRLVLDGVFLGNQGEDQPGQACRYVFERS